MADELFYSIAGYTLKIIFKPANLSFFRNKLISDVKAVYDGFKIPNLRAKTDFLIIISEQHHHFITKKKGRETYYFSYLFSSSNIKSVHTTYDISLHQITHLISNLVQKKLDKNNGFVFHASASLINNRASLFTGLSGAGKSTAVSLLKNSFTALADDLSIIKKVGKKYVFYQTPLIEKNDWIIKNNKNYEVGKIFFLQKSQDFKIKKITSKSDIIYELTKQLRVESYSLPSGMSNLLSFIKYFNEFYLLYFAKNGPKLINLLKTFASR